MDLEIFYARRKAVNGGPAENSILRRGKGCVPSVAKE